MPGLDGRLLGNDNVGGYFIISKMPMIASMVQFSNYCSRRT